MNIIIIAYFVYLTSIGVFLIIRFDELGLGSRRSKILVIFIYTILMLILFAVYATSF